MHRPNILALLLILSLSRASYASSRDLGIEKVNQSREFITELNRSHGAVNSTLAMQILKTVLTSVSDDPLQTQIEALVPLVRNNSRVFLTAISKLKEQEREYLQTSLLEVGREMDETVALDEEALLYNAATDPKQVLNWDDKIINPIYGERITDAAIALVGKRTRPINRKNPMCYHWVKEIYEEANIIDDVGELPGKSARLALRDFLGTKKFMKMNLSDESQALPGTACVYSGARWHVEVVGSDGKRYSEFRQKGPATTWGRKFVDCLIYIPSVESLGIWSI